MSERMTPEQTPMTGTRAANLLQNILKWKLQLTAPTPSVRSIPTDTDGIRTQNTDALPFGLDQVIDTTWGDGPNGTTTEAGVDKWLRFWTPWFSYWAGVEARLRMHPGPWMLKHLTENPVFTNPADWDSEDQDTWNEYTSELKTMHSRLATLTGHKPHNAGICPKCLTGTMQQHPKPKTGYDDEATCSNCQTTIPVEDLKRSRQQALRHVTTTDPNGEAWIYGKQAIEIYGGSLTWAHLRDWHKQGRLQRKGNKRNYQYPLNQVNILVLESQ